MRNFFYLVFLVVVCASVSAANDGVFYSQGGTLVPMQETQVRLQKEDLKFYVRDRNYVDVDIDFDFFNPGAEKIVVVGFVSPPAFGDVEDEHPQISQFATNVNGRDTKHKTARMDATSFRSVHEDGGKDYVYYFPVSFRKGLNKIHHSYRFRINGSVDMRRQIDYQITTGKRWANKQIDDFSLEIYLDNGIFFLPFSFSKSGKPAAWKIVGDGIFGKRVKGAYRDSPDGKMVHLRSGFLSFKERNFKPDLDISIGEYNWAGGWFPKMCITAARCPNSKDSNPNVFGYFYPNAGEYAEIESLREFSKTELKVIRNFPFAIQGYQFSDEKLVEYFSQFFWYKPIKDLKIEQIRLTADEQKLIETVKNLEKSK